MIWLELRIKGVGNNTLGEGVESESYWERRNTWFRTRCLVDILLNVKVDTAPHTTNERHRDRKDDLSSNSTMQREEHTAWQQPQSRRRGFHCLVKLARYLWGTAGLK